MKMKKKANLKMLLLSIFLTIATTAAAGFEGAARTRTLEQEVIPQHEVHCSRERSRTAWGIVEEYLMPFVEHEEYQLPSMCRLHADNDMFREQEQHKIHADTNEWRCGFCKKSFYAEKYLDQHFDNRHSNLINDSQGRCLADLCGALHCDLMTESKKNKNKCNPAATAKNRHICEKQSSIFYLACCILIVLLLPIFYFFVWLHQRGMRNGIQGLKRISKTGRKTKPS